MFVDPVLPDPVMVMVLVAPDGMTTEGRARLNDDTLGWLAGATGSNHGEGCQVGSGQSVDGEREGLVWVGSFWVKLTVAERWPLRWA